MSDFPGSKGQVLRFPHGDFARNAPVLWRQKSTVIPRSGSVKPLSAVWVECASDELTHEAVARCTLGVNRIESAAGGPLPAVPFGLWFELYAVVSGRRSLRAAFTWTPPDWNAGGQLVWYRGGLVEGFELWGRVDPAALEAFDVQLSGVRWICDRLGGDIQVTPGPNVVITAGP